MKNALIFLLTVGTAQVLLAQAAKSNSSSSPVADAEAARDLNEVSYRHKP